MQKRKSYEPLNVQLCLLLARAVGNKRASEVASSSGVSVVTVYNYRKGKSRRPQFGTAIAVLRACGYNVKFLRPKP